MAKIIPFPTPDDDPLSDENYKAHLEQLAADGLPLFMALDASDLENVQVVDSVYAADVLKDEDES